MSDVTDRWLWVIDEQLVHALIREDVVEPEAPKRQAGSALANVVALQSDGRTADAAAEAVRAIENGESTPDLWWARGQLEFELGHWEDARASYSELLKQVPEHRAANFNIALCFYKLRRYEDAVFQFA